jgi:hypothetical protein
MRVPLVVAVLATECHKECLDDDRHEFVIMLSLIDPLGPIVAERDHTLTNRFGFPNSWHTKVCCCVHVYLLILCERISTLEMEPASVDEKEQMATRVFQCPLDN